MKVQCPPSRGIFRLNVELTGQGFRRDDRRSETYHFPCCCSHEQRSAFMAMIFPVPAGSTSRSITRPDTVIFKSASVWSGPCIRTSRSGTRLCRRHAGIAPGRGQLWRGEPKPGTLGDIDDPPGHGFLIPRRREPESHRLPGCLDSEVPPVPARLFRTDGFDHRLCVCFELIERYVIRMKQPCLACGDRIARPFARIPAELLRCVSAPLFCEVCERAHRLLRPGQEGGLRAEFDDRHRILLWHEMARPRLPFAPIFRLAGISALDYLVRPYHPGATPIG